MIISNPYDPDYIRFSDGTIVYISRVDTGPYDLNGNPQYQATFTTPSINRPIDAWARVRDDAGTYLWKLPCMLEPGIFCDCVYNLFAGHCTVIFRWYPARPSAAFSSTAFSRGEIFLAWTKMP